MPSPPHPQVRVAADIGGTFTDLALIRPDGGVATCKVPSTPGDYGRGVIDGITQLLEQQGLVPGDVGEVLHACTIATNAILEAKGARTGLITTAGFRDVLELRRIRVPRLYEPLYRKPPPLVPRRLRLEVAERMDWQGQVLEPLDEASVMAAIDAMIDEGVEAVAVCLLHSYANPAHERRIGELLRARMPGAFVSLSVDILPEIREYERTSTTVINAYVGPPVHGYLNALVTRMAEQGLPRRLFMMHSAGGIVDAVTVMRRPAQIVECGPAAGVLSARHVGALAGYRDVISFDMGGTTAKASLIEGGALQRTDDYEVGGGISLSSKLAKGGGYALKLPVIDISEVGAGGGSIVWIDRAGALKVGPHSAGARPGPACYDAGGTEPTVTDANVVLGYLNPDSLAGGTLPIKGALSHAAIARAVAGPMGMTVDEAAFGVHELVTTVMTRAVKSVTTYRGRDPREFTLFAFGGNGGIHAVSLARTLGIQTVVVPPGAGVFSALGLLYADVETGASAACLRRIDAIPDAVLEAQFTALERGIAAELGQPGERVAMTRSADLRYAGQAFELTLPFGAGPYGAAALDAVRDTFEAAHARSYGYRLPGVAVEVVTLRAQGRLLPDGVPPQPRHALPPTARPSRRRVWFGPGCGAHDTLVTGRAALEGAAREGVAMAGPLVIEEYEGTTLVPPGCTAALDAHMNIVISVGPAPGPAGDAATEVAPTALRSIDPIRLEVVKNAFDTIADEMALILMRAAHSPIVRDSMDFSTALCDPAGQTLAQGVTTPMHLGSFYDAMRHLIARYAGDVVAGDTFVGNDPYAACGQHLPDFYIVQPIFIGPRLVGWATTVAHHADVGGIVPGSNALGATEIIQEGIRVPFLKLEEAGRPDRKLWEMIALNVRVPEQMVGDLNAQIAACNAGRRGLAELMARYGIDEIERYGRELHDYAERLTRAEIEEIPDGTYSFTDHLDGLGQHPVPIVFQCRLTVDGSTIHVDWTGSSRQVAGGVNTPLPFTKAGVYTALRSVMTSDIPNCHGFTRAITVTAPPGTVVNSVYPAPTGARGITGYRVIDCIFGALAAVLPDRVTADGMGGSSVPAFGGWSNGRPFVFSETLMGTWGAARTHDGQEGVPHMGANQANVPVEMMEASFPLRVRRYGIVPDTGGAGRHRGGNSLVRDYEYLAEEGVLTMRSDKRDFPPHGLEGGQPGCGPVTLVNPGANERLLPVLVTESVILKQGDLVHHQTPSGGGHGDPFHRDPADVLEDVLEQKVSPARARDAYGVAVTPAGRGFELDLVATAVLRAAR